MVNNMKTIHIYHEYYEFDFHCSKNYYVSKVGLWYAFFELWALATIGLRSKTLKSSKFPSST